VAGQESVAAVRVAAVAQIAFESLYRPRRVRSVCVVKHTLLNLSKYWRCLTELAVRVGYDRWAVVETVTGSEDWTVHEHERTVAVDVTVERRLLRAAPDADWIAKGVHIAPRDRDVSRGLRLVPEPHICSQSGRVHTPGDVDVSQIHRAVIERLDVPDNSGMPAVHA
jgi:hypothetical protein